MTATAPNATAIPAGVFTSKIEHIYKVKPYDSQHGKTFYFDMLTAEGHRGSIGKKKEDAFKPGDTFTYRMKPGKLKDTIDFVQCNPDGSDFGRGSQRGGSYSKGSGPQETPEMKNRVFALAYAKDIGVARVDKGHEVSAEWVIGVAEKFNNWLNKGGATNE